MRTIVFLLRKEFLQIFRNKGMLPIMFIMPFIQLIILSNAATFDVKNVQFSLIDKDRSVLSDLFAEHVGSSPYFTLTSGSMSDQQAFNAILEGRDKLSIVIPEDFEKDLYRYAQAKVQLMIDAEDGYSAGIIQAYTREIIESFNGTIISQRLLAPGTRTLTESPQVGNIRIISSSWFNPELDYIYFMVPGILVILVTMIGLFLSAMNIVREKEAGTIEQINVTPVKRYQFITGKLLPFWIIGLGELTVGLFIARVLFDVPMLGSYPLIYAVASIYLLVVLGMGMLISTVTETQQQAMFIAWFFMVIFVLMSGLFTTIESMPVWAQNLTLLNPVRFFVDIMRRIMLKGSGIQHIARETTGLAVYAVIMLSVAVNRYKKTSG